MLHDVIQLVFDWDDDHLHEFYTKNRGDGPVRLFHVMGMLWTKQGHIMKTVRS